MNTNTKPTEREDIESLLPWHAAGTLSRRDMERVEAALASDRELAQRYELVREELAEAIHLNESLGAPSVRAMNKLMAAIDAEAPVTRKVTFSLGAWLTEFVGSFAPRTLAYAGTAAAILLLLQAGVITGVLVKDRGGQNQLASYEDTIKAAGPTALVAFTPAASAADITKFLETYNAALVDGPKAGMFRVRVAGAATKEDLAKVILRMQNERAVVGFVAPAE